MFLGDSIEVTIPELQPRNNSTASQFNDADRCSFPSQMPEITSLVDIDASRAPEEQDTSPSQMSHHSYGSRNDLVAETTHRGDIDTGFLQVYGPENDLVAQEQALEDSMQPQLLPDTQPPDLMESFAETYWEYCYAWCPILDPEHLFEELSRSHLLANALAAAATHIQPPLVPHLGPAKYYTKARCAFYNDEEPDPVTALKSVALFYWWAPRAPTTVHRHSSWWWTSVLIRHAQQMNMHREPTTAHPLRTEYMLSVRRRIWWTAFVSILYKYSFQCRKMYFFHYGSFHANTAVSAF